ncbi:hypothetical protein F53441_11080 [Fusarium austroafricanum]|uniref:ribonuclease H n=1 Tax=Fusarium austroafricanum TaxID=2364996 RepID=A0A8H4K6P1_9HYPO|nr:hypothetical protein F53441_11080 [Fusarium austroafricanum]
MFDNMLTYHYLLCFASSDKEPAHHFNRYISVSRSSAHTSSRKPVDLSIFNFLLTAPTITTADPRSCSTSYEDYPDEHEADMVKKRGAPSNGFEAGSSSKIRKVENATKYYAVKKGRKPGIYLIYQESRAQTDGFEGALFKSFTSAQDAQDYLDGKDVPSATKRSQKFYAVAVGHRPGIYTTWAETEPQVTGVSGPKHKSFKSRPEAEQFIRDHASLETCQALGIEVGQGLPTQQYTGAAFEPVEPAAKKTKPEPTAATSAESTSGTNGRLLKIYTDGSSRGNGKAGACAGLGVYFGRDDERNLAERLPGEPQTNQRGELMAMLRALEIAPLTQGVQIWSDSQYSIKCVTQWAASWENKGWKTASGGEVKNQDIIRGVLAKMKERTEAGSVTTFQWVKGHANDPGNNEADRLANIGATMPAV